MEGSISMGFFFKQNLNYPFSQLLNIIKYINITLYFFRLFLRSTCSVFAPYLLRTWLVFNLSFGNVNKSIFNNVLLVTKKINRHLNQKR